MASTQTQLDVTETPQVYRFAATGWHTVQVNGDNRVYYQLVQGDCPTSNSDARVTALSGADAVIQDLADGWLEDSGVTASGRGESLLCDPSVIGIILACQTGESSTVRVHAGGVSA